MTRQTPVQLKMQVFCKGMPLDWDKDGLSEERSFVDRVLAGNRYACERFIDESTDAVLVRIRELRKSHCHNNSREQLCSLRVLLKMRKGQSDYIGEKHQCDECMDSYVWFLEHLKARLKSYKGINGSSLKTYVWSVINSHNTYIDWLRWKYGRLF